MKNLTSDEISLQEKLQLVANGVDVELTKKESIIFGLDVADILPDEDCVIEQEG